MRSLVDFLNHGALPFTGRKEEIAGLVDFWRGTVEAQGLRVALLQGEGGIGKSRLVEELIPRIVQGGGVVVHAKFYPESTASIAPLLARATWLSRGGRKLLAAEPEGTLSSVVTALQRIARLRPTLVVIEDLHLLADELSDDRALPTRELATLLGSLAGETISLLCAARPLPAGLRGLIEPWLVREIPLGGLEPEDYRSIWSRLFGGTAADEMLLPLQEATLGNPLAIRSALRGAINAGAIARNSAEEGWQLGVPADAFARRLEQSVGILSEGMAVHLSPAEREAACRVAMLGEVIARESAMLLLTDSGRSLDGLVFKGILVPSESAAPPLGLPASTRPLLAFSHTLVHRHFVARTTLGAGDLLRLVASAEAPLYSRLPFQLLPTLSHPVEIESAILRQAIVRCFDVAYAIDRTSDWKRATEIWEVARWLLQQYGERFSLEDRFELEARSITIRLGLLWRSPLDEEYLRLVDRFLELTGELTEGPALHYRLRALLYGDRTTWRTDPAAAAAYRSQITTLVAGAPELRSTWPYIDHLRDVAHAAWAGGDHAALRRMEAQLDDLVGIENLDPELRQSALHGTQRYLINLFDTPEELARRKELLVALEAAGIASEPLVMVQRLSFHESIGEIDRVVELARVALPQIEEQGLQIEIAMTRLAQIVASILLGSDLEEALVAVATLHESVPAPIARRLHSTIVTRVTRALLLCGHESSARQIVERFGNDAAVLPDAVARLLGMREEPIALESNSPLLRLDDLLLGSAALLDGGSADDLVPLLDWAAERRLPALLSALLDRHRSMLGARDLARWKKRTDELQRQRRAEQMVAESLTDERMRVTMLGVIEIERPGAEPNRLRGARLRSVLGVMVAELLIPEPLEYREFCRIAAGEDDPESARKILNVTVFRLRESMGAEAIITGGETPRLNMEILTIDLVEAYRRIRSAAEAARGGTLVRALPMLREAIAMIGGEVPFPGLYDSFFEALRGDLELELRAAIIDVATGLMREGDAGSAEELLRYGTTTMPGDAALTDLLRTALVALGRRADAERVRMRGE
jgi:DNA-binding SARP family transcriptional activator